MKALAAIGLAVLLGGCAAGEGSPAAGTANVAGTVDPKPGEPPIPEGLVFVWTIKGSTASPTLNNATYFNGPRDPKLQPGAVYVAWSCSGNGQLAIQPSIVGGPGSVVPASTATVLAFHISCPTQPGELRWIQLTAPALGGEDVVVIRPAVQPSGLIEYEIGFAQAPS